MFFQLKLMILYLQELRAKRALTEPFRYDESGWKAFYISRSEGSGTELIPDKESFVSFLVSRLMFKQSIGLFKSHLCKGY